ncbi:MAG: TIGR04190 family B12-binding domain/radical SAM domain protein [Candidatus Asgardarchaeia archaeon]
MKLLQIHAPAFYDFRKHYTYYGPISDVIPSSPIFDMYPLGFVSIASHLEKAGHKAEILNLAAMMLMERNYDADKRLQKINADIVSIDLHWLVHAQGALEVAKIVKEYHPDIPIVFGGLSSTYFWKELIRHPQVDFIVLGDTTELPMEQLLNSLEKGKPLDDIPNLIWKKTSNQVVMNKFSYVPSRVPFIDYDVLASRLIRTRHWKEWLPYASFIEAPITAIFTIKGCMFNCKTCGGSNFSYRTFFNRQKLAVKNPYDILKEVRFISDYTKVAIFFVGDLRTTGHAYEIIDLLRREKIENPLIFEFFSPPSKSYLKKLRTASEGDILLQISPESHDDVVRNAFGRPYSTASLLKFIRTAKELDFTRLDLYFMIGLPKQTYESAIKTAEFAGSLVDEKLDAFIAPLAPFVDPGSMVFENPEQFGYRLLFKSLEEHRRAFYARHWYQYLNYETVYMSRETIAKASNDAILKLAELKYERGKLSERELSHVQEAVALIKNGDSKVDHIVHRREELYPTKNLLKLIRLKPKTVYYFLKLLFGGL